MSEVVIYDRSVLITEKADIERFLSDPEKFLADVGALEGFPDFNGVTWIDGGDLKSTDISKLDDEEIVGIKCSHLGIPYRDYCGWRSCAIKKL